MKLYKTLALMGIASFMLTACSDDDNWEPGADYNTTNQVSIVSDTPASQVIDPNEAYSLNVKFSRENTQGAMTVPLIASDREHFQVPESVSFADGDATAEITVGFLPTSESGQYDLEISYADGAYNSPYTKVKTKEYISILVIEWELVSDNVHVYSSNNNIPEYYTSLLKGKGLDIYTLKNFMVGVDLTFDAVEANSGTWSPGTYFIKPKGGSQGADPFSWGYYVWYFSPNLADTYPMVWPSDPDHLYDYCFIGIDENWTSYIVPDSRYGLICWDFSQYSYNDEHVTSDDTYITGTDDYLYFVY